MLMLAILIRVKPHQSVINPSLGSSKIINPSKVKTVLGILPCFGIWIWGVFAYLGRAPAVGAESMPLIRKVLDYFWAHLPLAIFLATLLRVDTPNRLGLI